ncbi:MAG: NAD-dependent epimerase/dehydratase family protein [Myxococcales bacterium]|nr:NAD-dependent epimerase/dehydratase family protein [Myxococcales bacterium]
MKALIIGAGGQIGSELAGALEAAGHEAWMVDHQPLEKCAGRGALEASFAQYPGLAARWLPALDVLQADRLAALIADLRPDTVFHLAALLSATGEANPDLCWRVNVDGLRTTLEAMTRYRRPDGADPVLVCPSSIAAYGPVTGRPDVLERGPEEGPLEPTTMYGVTKVVAERLGAWYSHQLRPTDGRGRVDTRLLRFPGLLSAVPPGGGSSDYANELFFAGARGDQAVQIFVRPDTRIPFMHMDDALRSLVELAEAPRARLTRTTYNVGACYPTAEEIAEAVRRRLDHPFEVRYVPDHRQAFVDSWPRRLEDGAARSDWGWSHRLDLEGMTDRLLHDCRASLAR